MHLPAGSKRYALLLAGALALPAQAATYNFDCFEGCDRVPPGLGQ